MEGFVANYQTITDTGVDIKCWRITSSDFFLIDFSRYSQIDDYD
jgi:hypothetical protein